MRNRRLLATMCAFALTSGCATQALWQATNPEAIVAVPESRVSEAELRESGVPYRKEDGLYYVGKTQSERFGDHALRFVFTPATVCLDVAPVLALAAAQGFLDDLSVKSGGQRSPTPILPRGVTGDD